VRGVIARLITGSGTFMDVIVYLPHGAALSGGRGARRPRRTAPALGGRLECCMAWRRRARARTARSRR